MTEGITNTTRGQGDVLPSSQGGTETEVEEVLVAEMEESGSYCG